MPEQTNRFETGSVAKLPFAADVLANGDDVASTFVTWRTRLAVLTAYSIYLPAQSQAIAIRR
jgi:hypothetical protein